MYCKPLYVPESQTGGSLYNNRILRTQGGSVSTIIKPSPEIEQSIPQYPFNNW
jgi:hypothetical protein